MRCFICVDFPFNVEKEIFGIQQNLPAFSGKIISRENLHLTLKFLREIDDKSIEAVREILRKIEFKSFEISFGELGVFSEDFVRIVWIRLNGINELQKKIDSALEGLFEPEKRFMSHLTIARVKSVKEKNNFLRELNKIRVPEIHFNINSFKLKKSTLTPNGPLYETIEEFYLN